MTPPSSQATVSARRTSTPIIDESSRSLASDRIDNPTRVLLRNAVIAIVTNSARTITNARVKVTVTSPILKLHSSVGRSSFWMRAVHRQPQNPRMNSPNPSAPIARTIGSRRDSRGEITSP